MSSGRKPRDLTLKKKLVIFKFWLYLSLTITARSNLEKEVDYISVYLVYCIYCFLFIISKSISRLVFLITYSPQSDYILFVALSALYGSTSKS